MLIHPIRAIDITIVRTLIVAESVVCISLATKTTKKKNMYLIHSLKSTLVDTTHLVYKSHYIGLTLPVYITYLVHVTYNSAFIHHVDITPG